MVFQVSQHQVPPPAVSFLEQQQSHNNKSYTKKLLLKTTAEPAKVPGSECASANEATKQSGMASVTDATPLL